MDPAKDERDARTHRPVKERQVLDRLKVSPSLGVDLLSAAIDRHGLEVELVVDPFSPAQAVRIPHAPADIGDRRQSHLDELVVEKEGSPLLDQLLEAGRVAPDRHVRGQHEVRTNLEELARQLRPAPPYAFKGPVVDEELERDPGPARACTRL